MQRFSRRSVLATLAAISVLRPDRVHAGPIHLDSTRFAVGGYDTVAFHDLPSGGSRPARPVAGSRRFIETWQGASWAFASDENRQRFVMDPARYAPQFDGHCAWAAGNGYKAPGSPAAWRIVDGRLYLNYSQRVRRLWEPERTRLIVEGDRHWARLGAEAAAEGDAKDYNPRSAPIA